MSLVKTAYVFNFESFTPPHICSQETSLEWLQTAYQLQDNSTRNERFLRYCVKPHQIAQRAFFHPDFAELDFHKHQLFRPDHRPSASQRNQFFATVVDEACEALYQQRQIELPKAFYHVSCTGYISPSPIQRLAIRKGWRQARVRHLYHMGCYAAFPAIDMAWRELQAEPKAASIEVLHSELCSLHLNLESMNPEQAVIHSLFSDGMIAYQLSNRKPVGRSLQIIHCQEELLLDSQDLMSWSLSEGGMQMTLSREVPARISTQIGDFVNRLCAGRIDPTRAIFAVHPGGPSILDQVAEALKLSDWQMAHSREILYTRGNMSSATVAHIWQKILQERELAPQTPVVSLAFGPGLSLCGAVFILNRDGES